MSIVLLTSIALRLAALALALRLWFRIKDWRIVFLAGLIALMAARQILPLSKAPLGDALSFTENIDELPGLFVSILAFLALVFLEKMIRRERRRSESLRKSEAEHRAVLDNMIDTFYRGDGEGRIVMASRSAIDLLGFAPEELIGTRLADLYVDAAGHDAFLAHMEEQGGFVRGYETALRRKDGTIAWVSANARYTRDGTGNVVGIEGTARDITQQKRAEEALRKNTAYLAGIAENLPGIVFRRVLHADGSVEFPYLSPKLKDYFGLDPEAAVADAHLLVETVHPDDAVAWRRVLEESARGLTPFNFENRIVRPDGEIRWMRTTALPQRRENGDVIWDGVALDVTKRKQAEEALKESETRLKAVIDNSPTAILLKDLEGRFRVINKRYEEWHGLRRVDMAEVTTHDMFPSTIADELTAFDRHVLDSGAVHEHEQDLPFADGTTRKVLITKFPVYDSDGKAIGVGTIGSDVTNQRRTQEQLRQAQKMETVGQLTGGVAHDFNNLLAVILGNLELAEEELENEEKALNFIATAKRAAMRGAGLTEQLLAFSRKQILRPESIDLNTHLLGMSDLLHRTLGETIEIETIAAVDLWPILADRVQIENSILNLAINARDAMRKGGKLTIETGNASLDDEDAAAHEDVKPGDYVVLAVTDTGTGMPPQVLQHAFEPFFTTKQPGAGSGLGLSMVYGFAKQSGGHATISSKEGQGTTVKLYLPRTRERAVAEAEPAAAPEQVGRGEAILVVEDHADVRGLAVTLLTDLGYRVRSAGDGIAALAALADNPGFDMLLSDVVLPSGMSGPELAAKARDTHPRMKTLFMSGYAANAVAHQGQLDEGVRLLQKPFSKWDLARMVRDVLDGPEA